MGTLEGAGRGEGYITQRRWKEKGWRHTEVEGKKIGDTHRKRKKGGWRHIEEMEGGI